MSSPHSAPYAQADFSGYLRQQDAAHLNLLRIFHFIWGGILAVFSLFPAIHVTLGILMLTGHLDDNGQPMPAAIGWMFIVFGGFAILFGEAVALATIYSGVMIQRRCRRMFSIVMACVNCLFTPFGTILGIFTIVVLLRESVKLTAYGGPEAAHASAF